MIYGMDLEVLAFTLPSGYHLANSQHAHQLTPIRSADSDRRRWLYYRRFASYQIAVDLLLRKIPKTPSIHVKPRDIWPWKESRVLLPFVPNILDKALMQLCSHPAIHVRVGANILGRITGYLLEENNSHSSVDQRINYWADQIVRKAHGLTLQPCGVIPKRRGFGAREVFQTWANHLPLATVEVFTMKYDASEQVCISGGAEQASTSNSQFSITEPQTAEEPIIPRSTDPPFKSICLVAKGQDSWSMPEASHLTGPEVPD